MNVFARLPESFMKIHEQPEASRSAACTIALTGKEVQPMNAPVTPESPRYRFADLTLDVGQCRVSRGDEVIPLVKLNFDLLRVLVEHAPNVVRHEQLARQVWGPRRTVTPENLAKRVNLLRQALDDRATHSSYIEGIRGHGYRLIPDVHLAGQQEWVEGGIVSDPARPVQTQIVAPTISPAPPPSAARRNVLVGALAVAVGALTLDGYRLRRLLRETGATTTDPSANGQPHSFELYAPSSSAFNASPGWPQPALAPGGRDLAFIARSGSSTDVIWVQTLGHLDALPLRGTERASWPFWSADGRFIGFAANGHLKRVSATGGIAPADIAPLGGPYWGGAWAGDDTLLYGGEAGLYRVAASGGSPAVWTKLDADAGEFSHRFPVMLPDGRRFVYLALSTNADRHGLYVGSLDDPGTRIRLRSGESKAALGFDANGTLHLLFAGEHGELLAQPFDASYTRLVGDAVEVAPPYSVEINGSARASAVTACDRVLVYRPRVSARTRLVWRDRTGAHEETIALPEGAYRHLALSHDGTMLTVERDALDDASGLWLIDRPRNQNRRLGAGQMSAWTPDDGRILYSNVRPEGWRIDMKRVAADTEAQALVAGPHPFVKRIRDVTRNGLLFQCEIAGDSWLYYWPFTGGEPQELPLPVRRPGHARVSPDERWLAFSATDAGETHIYVTAFPDLGETVRVSTSQGTDPQWRGDGRELYYVTLTQTLMAVTVTATDTLTFGSPVPLFHVTLDRRSLELSSAYAPAPDGQRFIVAEANDREEPRLRVRLNWGRRI
jgi:DNA-binding winged helix-turn-helix (wHTH) protein